MSAAFDFVCRDCRRVGFHDMNCLRGESPFACPYCKAEFKVVDNRILQVATRARMIPLPRHTDAVREA